MGSTGRKPLTPAPDQNRRPFSWHYPAAKPANLSGGTMDVLNWKDCEDIQIKKFPYRGHQNDVKGISIRWLSKHGDDGTGYPEYGLRFFTAQPKGEIPIHNHFYHQTMYILSGQFECFQFDPKTDEVVKKKICGPGDFIYVPSLEPHGMKNTSDTQPATFLCCICNVYDRKDD
jgi:quercetin dioxygenase-like cupin family protein